MDYDFFNMLSDGAMVCATIAENEKVKVVRSVRRRPHDHVIVVWDTVYRRVGIALYEAGSTPAREYGWRIPAGGREDDDLPSFWAEVEGFEFV